MIIHINYQTQYAYSEPVSFSSHVFRLFPKCDRYLSIRSLEFQTNPDATINYNRDLFDNEIASCFYPGQSALLSASLRMTLDIQPRNAFGFLLANHAVNMPFTYSEEEAHLLEPYLRLDGPAPVLPFWSPPTEPSPTISALTELNHALHRNIAYERREEGAAYAAEETLRLGCGSCRDFSVLLASVARGLGIAARLASGYLCEFGEGDKKAEGALHAWTELYLPGAGWVGFDPTNGYLTNHNHITAAVGLTPEDISPILGNYFHPTSVTSEMTATLQISPHMKTPESLEAVAEKVDALFLKHKAPLTLGGEPTYVPIDPVGPEWHVTALGPTKLKYGYALAKTLIAQSVPNAITIYSPGKYYPGEVNPRWSINLLWNRDDSPLVPALARILVDGAEPDPKSAGQFCKNLLRRLKLGAGWMRGTDPFDEHRFVRVLPLDYDGKHFITQDWKMGDAIELIRAEGPAGLRLPLASLPEGVNRRALAVEIRDDTLHLFLPPLLQAPFLELLEHVTEALHHAGLKPATFAGYVPSDEAGIWCRMAIAADPGVLEINLPPCHTWREYALWMDRLEHAAAPAGLRSFKQITAEDQIGTGGGNHLLFGGPTLDTNPLFTRPAWVTSILRYWQHHPSLAYLFTGQYVGSSSQAPRPDEGATALYDLEMAYLFLEQLPPGDHRYMISETLRHLHTDTSGNTHRSETSFDKFWNVNFDGGSRGLIEFRALESLPHARWMSAIALLWHALAARLLANPYQKPLIDHGDKLHDFYFLPTCLRDDFEKVLRDLRKAGLKLPATIYREIFEWRFPIMLEHKDGDTSLTIRRAHEGWPLLCETPLEGGSTSRFVDTSIERLELIGNHEFFAHSKIHVHGRPLPLERFPGGRFGVGLRYRRTALYPSLHPGIPPQMPLLLTITRDGQDTLYRLEEDHRHFQRCPEGTPLPAVGAPCKRLNRGLVTCDLRLQ